MTKRELIDQIVEVRILIGAGNEFISKVQAESNVNQAWHILYQLAKELEKYDLTEI